MKTTSSRAAEIGAGLFLIALFVRFIQQGSFEIAGERVYTLFDDAMISMRYARNLAAGHGLTWNAGEPAVEGFTNPLWTLWMALLHLVGIPPRTVGLWVSATSACLVFASAFTMRALARQLSPHDRVLPLFAFWGTATYYPLVFWSLRGMEVGLVVLLMSVAVLMSLRLQDRFDRSTLTTLAVSLCLATLTRMELLAPAVLIAAFLTWRLPGHRRQIATLVGGSLIGTLAVLTLLRLLYYGEWLPNTYYLKLGGVSLGDRLRRGSAFLAVVSAMHLSGLLLLVAYAAWQRRGRLRAAEWLLLGLYALLCAYSAWVGGDAWDFYAFANRFITPGVPLLMLLALKFTGDAVATPEPRSLRWLAGAFIVAGACDWLPVRAEEMGPVALRGVAFLVPAAALLAAPRLIRRHRVAPAHRLIAGALLFGLNVNPVAGSVLYGAPHNRGDQAWSAYGLLIRETSTPDATVAVTWAGNATYFSERITFDQLGKTDGVIAHGPNVSPVFRPGHSKWNFERTFGELKPDIIAALYYVTEADLANIEGWGYTRLVGNCYVRGDSAKVDVGALRAGLIALSIDPRFSDTLCVRQVNGSAFPATWLPDSRQSLTRPAQPHVDASR